ncbi:radical SAM protein [Sphingosinicellaceae bacterium]|nr:radical SAM protein [Sphingosinicellaceae bacterium]
MDEATGAGHEQGPLAIFHVHPSLRCNLACAHCYSSSSPAARDALPVEAIVTAIDDAAGLGCNVLSVSGGEPLMYAGLPRLLETARAHNMRTQIVTNGWFLGSPALAAAAPWLHLVAISLDGPAAVHDRMRGSPRAFERLVAGLAKIRALGVDFGFVHTVTAENWDQLFATAAFAASAGAKLFQLHPLEMAGRATTDAGPLVLDADTAAKVYVLAAILKARYAGTMAVQVDLLHRTQLRPPSDEDGLAAALGILVMEADGVVVPLAYGFDRRFAVCDIGRARLADAWPGFVREKLPAYRALAARLHRELARADAPDLCNWYELMVDRSARAPVGDMAPA